MDPLTLIKSIDVHFGEDMDCAGCAFAFDALHNRNCVAELLKECRNALCAMTSEPKEGEAPF